MRLKLIGFATACLMLVACESTQSEAAPQLVASEKILNPAPAGEDPVAWTSVTTEGDGRVLVITYERGNRSCYPPSRLKVTPRNGVAVVELFTAKAAPGRTCTSELIGGPERFTLGNPIPAGTGFARVN